MTRRPHLRAALFLAAPLTATVALTTSCVPVLTLTVTTTVDANDASPGDGVCEATPGGGDCTLRAAVDEANATAGLVEIDVPSAAYVLTKPGVEEFNLGGDLDIRGDVRLRPMPGPAGSGPYTIDGGLIDRVIDVQPSFKLDVDLASIIQGATDTNGGGIRVRAQASLTLTHTRVTANTARGFGGGIAVIDGTATIDRSLLHYNEATAGGGLGNVGSNVTTSILNSTISGNHASEFGPGAGPFGIGVGGGIATNGRLRATFTTIRANTALGAGTGGGIFMATVVPELRATTVSEHGAPLDCAGGPVVTLGFNNDKDGSCLAAAPSPTDIVATDPLLLPLAFNGGPTETHLPVAASPLVDTIPAGTPLVCDGSVKVDQRDAARPSAAPPCDRGAVEL